MNSAEQQLKRLEQMIGFINQSYVKPEDLAQLFESFSSIIKDLKINLVKSMESADMMLGEKIIEENKKSLNMIKDLESKLLGIITQNQKNDDKEDADNFKAIEKMVNDIKASIPTPTDTKYLDKQITALEYKINSLPTAKSIEETLSYQFQAIINGIAIEFRKEIKDLKNMYDKMSKGKKDGIQFVGSPGSGGKVVKVWDLTPYLNGATKTFKLPAFWRITSIQSTSAPFTFEPGIDYTVDYTTMSITFTSVVDAPSTLSTGQSVIVLYAET